jgi:hypothetical protein
MKLKRYDFYGSFDGGGPAISEASDDGDYVLFSDHEAALAAAMAALKQIADPNAFLHSGDDASLARRYEEIAQAALDARKEEGK